MAIMSYMGTKVALAERVAATFDDLPSGPLLELFAGMSAVGVATSRSRPLWTNDVQHFASLVCEFQFLSDYDAGTISEIAAAIVSEACNHMERPDPTIARLIAGERRVVSTRDWVELSESEEYLRQWCLSESAAILRKQPYSLFSTTYAGSYFGLEQCVEIDSLRRAIDRMFPPEMEKTMSYRRWSLSALGGAMLKSSNSTGHFAQYLRANESNSRRILSKRKRRVIEEWERLALNIRPVGDASWRLNNKTFKSDALSLLEKLNQGSKSPAVVYADPPYTADHYSRFYHLLDTMVLYDYPAANGRGLYRQDRFVSDWSVKTKVESCFEQLALAVSKLGSALVISYPDKGLLRNAQQVLPDILRSSFRSVTCLEPMSHSHSTMGASKGRQRHQVNELLFVAM